MMKNIFSLFTNNHQETEQKTKPEDIGKEVLAFQLSNYYKLDMERWMMNPDELIQQKDWDFYDEVKSDGTYHACFAIKNYARLSTGWDIPPVSEDKIDEEIAKFCKENLQKMEGTFQYKLEEIYSAQTYGFSVTEIIWDYIKSGQWKGKIRVKDLKTRLPHYLHFQTDKHGNIEKVIQEVYDLSKGRAPTIEIDPEKCIIYSFNPEFGNPYGTSDIKYIYKHYIAKKWVMRFWNIALERWGMGLTVGKYPRQSRKAKSDLEDQLNNFQATTALTIPDDVELEVLQAIGKGKSPYDEAMTKQNKLISRALLLPDKLGFTEGEYGSYAKAQVEFDIFMMLMKKLKRESEEHILQEQLLKPLVRYNYGERAQVPRFQFAPLHEEDKLEIAKTYSALVRSGSITPTDEDEKYARQILGFPEINPNNRKTIVGQEDDPTQKKLDEIYDLLSQKEVMQEVNKEVNPLTDLKGAKAFHYQEVGRLQDELEKNLQADVEDVVSKMRKKFFSDIEQKGLTNVDNPPSTAQIKKLDLSYKGDMRGVLEKWLVLSYLNSKHTALQEVQRAGYLPDELRKYIYTEDFSLKGSIGLSPEEAYKYFKNKIPILKKQLKYYKDRSFTITGVLSKDILGECQVALQEHVRRGDKQWIQKRLRKIWEKYEPTGQLDKAGNLKTSHRLEIIRRTNMSEALNSGRMAMYENKYLQEIIRGYQANAVLDSRTTDYCESIHGKVFRKSDFVSPPFHYQCRTTFTPVYYDEKFQYKNWKPSTYEGFSEEQRELVFFHGIPINKEVYRADT